MKSIIIIGAGACGIGAAITLIENNIHPIILEATNNIGGRIKTEKLEKNLIKFKDTTSSNFVNIDMGANWIHGMCDTNPFYLFAKEMNIKLYKTSSDDEPGNDILLFDKTDNGIKKFSNLEYEECLECLNWIRNNYESEDGISISEVFHNTIKKYENKFNILTEQQKRFFYWYLDRISINLNNSVNDIDSSFYYGKNKSDGMHGECLVDGGLYNLFQLISKKYPLDIKYNHIVTKIINNDTNVIIECKNGKKFMCDKCLITVSISVLQNNLISFEPVEPKYIKEIKNKYNLGLMNIIYLWYPYIFWPQEYNFFGITKNINDTKNIFNTFLVPYIYDNFGERQPILMCQTFGTFAYEIEHMEVCEIANMVTACLQNMFIEIKVPEAIACKCSTWYNDKFTFGSWSYIKKNNIISDQNFKDKILYASEALDDNNRGTVHGAFLIGQKYANQIILN